MKQQFPECNGGSCRNTPPLGEAYCGKCQRALEQGNELEALKDEVRMQVAQVTDPEARNALEALFEYVKALNEAT